MTSQRGLGRDFWRLFIGDTISMLGSAVSGLAIQFLLIDTLKADQRQIGLVRAAEFAPYLVLGLLVGVYVDRHRRRPILVTCDLIAAAVFTAIGVLALRGQLTVGWLAGLVFVAGTVSCVAIAAFQSFVPRLVAAPDVPSAFARMEQAGSATESFGPLVSGSLVRFLSAPVAVIVDAATYALSAVMVSRIRTVEPVHSGGQLHVIDDLREGARFVYRHPMLRSYALWLHAWFVVHAVIATILVHYCVTVLHLGPLLVGLTFAAAGVTGVLAAGMAPRLGERFGTGRAIAVAELATPASAALLALARPGPWALPVVVLAQVLAGVRAISSSQMMSYRTAVTPDRLRARMNGTIRTVNWGGLAIASFVGGAIATRIGDRATLGWAAGAAVLVTVYLWRSPFRGATMPDADAVSPA